MHTRSRRPRKGVYQAQPYDMMAQWNAMVAPMMSGMNRMLGDMAASWSDMMGASMREWGGDWGRMTMPRHRRQHKKYYHPHDCDCPECEPCVHDSCACDCCIGDADLAIYTRLGERRIVPVTIENSRRREKTVKLELSSWTTRRGKPVEGLTAAVVPAESFELGPCESKEALIVVQFVGSQLGKAEEGGKTFEDSVRDIAGAAVADAEKVAARTRIQLPDVEDCEVFYADLKVEGCEIRPIRLALAVLPRDCDVYEIHCRCGCC